MDLADIWLEIPQEKSDEVMMDRIIDSYKDFLSNNFFDDHYAIVNGGEDGLPILLITDAPENILADQRNGYAIYLYTYIDGQVVAVDNGYQITQRMSSGPWYFYENKLYALEGRGGYTRLDIAGISYDRVFIDSDDYYDIFGEENMVELQKNTLYLTVSQNAAEVTA